MAANALSMERKILVTADGSSTIEMPTGDTYHSRHGAIQESIHIFINAGLDYYVNSHPGVKHISIFETGFGTGLNALLTVQYAQAHSLTLNYEAVEPFPLTMEEVSDINYGQLSGVQALFERIHQSTWNQSVEMLPDINIIKHLCSLQGVDVKETVHIIYHDAFSPGSQPELWTEEIFQKLYDILMPGGILLTYCSKVIVQKAMKASGFTIEKVAGPFGKRDIIRAKKEL